MHFRQARRAAAGSAAIIVGLPSRSPCTTVMRMLGTHTQKLPEKKRSAAAYSGSSVTKAALTLICWQIFLTDWRYRCSAHRFAN